MNEKLSEPALRRAVAHISEAVALVEGELGVAAATECSDLLTRAALWLARKHHNVPTGKGG